MRGPYAKVAARNAGLLARITIGTLTSSRMQRTDTGNFYDRSKSWNDLRKLVH